MKTTELLFLFLVLASTQAISADIIRGEQIAAEMEKRASGFRPFSVNATLVNVDKDGTESYPREIRFRIMDSAKKMGGYLSFAEVMAPTRIRGTAYLTISHILEPNTQWRYTPAFGRKTNISDPQGSFLESEFSYEDLADQEVRKFSYAYLRDELCDNISCFVLERIPKKKSAYTKQVVWVDAAEYRVHKAELYGKASTIVKSVAVRDYQRVQGRFWWPSTVEVRTASGRVSRIKYSGYGVDTGVTPQVFNPALIKENRTAGN